MSTGFFIDHVNISKAEDSEFSQKFLSEELIFVEKIRDRFAYGVFFRYKNQLRVKFQENLHSFSVLTVFPLFLPLGPISPTKPLKPRPNPW